MMTSLGRRAASTIAQRSAPHVNLTRHAPRADTVAPAVVTAVSQLTPTVTQLMLRVDDARFGFRPGQWVDLFVGDGVGGFSICSEPRALPALELAVKAPARAPPGRAPPPVTDWCCARARAGDAVAVRAGGACTHDAAAAPRGARRPLVLAAGGIGINPLLSMLRDLAAQLRDERRADAASRGAARAVDAAAARAPPSATLLYAASDLREFAFREDLERLAAEFPGDVRCEFFLDDDGRESLPAARSAGVTWRRGRIDDEALRAAAAAPPGGARPRWFLCGPPAMIDAVSDGLVARVGVDADDVHFERWW